MVLRRGFETSAVSSNASSLLFVIAMTMSSVIVIARLIDARDACVTPTAVCVSCVIEQLRALP
jgi:hypothetical protein